MARRAAAQSSLPYTRERIWPPSVPRVGPWYGRRSAPSSIYNLVFIVYSALRTPLSATRVMVGFFGIPATWARSGSTPGRPARLASAYDPPVPGDSVGCLEGRRTRASAAPTSEEPLLIRCTDRVSHLGGIESCAYTPLLMASPTQSIFLVSDNFSVDKAPVGAISRFQAGTHHLFGAALHLLSGTAVDTRCHGYAKQEGSHDSPSPTLTLLMWLPPQREMS